MLLSVVRKDSFSTKIFKSVVRHKISIIKIYIDHYFTCMNLFVKKHDAPVISNSMLYNDKSLNAITSKKIIVLLTLIM